MYLQGYISANGMDIPLSGKYDQNEMYKQLLGVINDTNLSAYFSFLSLLYSPHKH